MLNKVQLIGNLGADPETRHTAAGNAVTNLRVATSKKWRDKQSGEHQEKTEWHRCVLFNRLAEVAGQYLRKGSKVYLEGEIQTRKWQGSDGNDRWTTEVLVFQLHMLDGRPDNGGSSSGHQNESPETPPLEDDIPF